MSPSELFQPSELTVDRSRTFPYIIGINSFLEHFFTIVVKPFSSLSKIPKTGILLDAHNP